MQKTRKAITPIIGIIILLLIVIALAGSAYVYIFGIFQGQVANTIQISPGSSSENHLILSNLGTEPLRISDLTITVNGQEATILNTGSIDARGSALLEYCSPVTGNNLNVRITGPSNVEETRTSIHYNRVFVAESTHNGNLGGYSGADTLCQSNATAYGLGGTWMAWISDSNSNVSDRFEHSSYPYVLLNCTKIADNWNDLTDGNLDAPINLGITGYTSGFVWTGTNSDGTARTDFNCLDWTDDTGTEFGRRGISTAAGSGWTLDTIQSTCNSQLLIYCFEQPS